MPLQNTVCCGGDGLEQEKHKPSRRLYLRTLSTGYPSFVGKDLFDWGVLVLRKFSGLHPCVMTAFCFCRQNMKDFVIYNRYYLVVNQWIQPDDHVPVTERCTLAKFTAVVNLTVRMLERRTC